MMTTMKNILMVLVMLFSFACGKKGEIATD